MVTPIYHCSAVASDDSIRWVVWKFVSPGWWVRVWSMPYHQADSPEDAVRQFHVVGSYSHA